MRQTNLFEFLNDFEEALRQEAYKKTVTEPEVSSMTPINELVQTFIKRCVKDNRLPTLTEAQTIRILYEINTEHQGSL